MNLIRKSQGKKRVMCVGKNCLDIVIVNNGFPVEDTETRCIDLIWQRGGNASNTCTTLSLLGQQCELLTVLSDSKENRFLEDDLISLGIRTDHCVVAEGRTPCATVISNIQNGSRTILARPMGTEITFEDFKKIDLKEESYGWIHFQGRPNSDDIVKMLNHIDEYNGDPSTEPNNKICTSAEMERPKEFSVPLLGKADVVFVSKDFAKWQGCSSMIEAVDKLSRKATWTRKGAILVCPWGAEGAAARTADGQIVTSPAFPPDVLLDTLGAGDTFNGATIAALYNGLGVEDAIRFGCQVAGTKCGLRGWTGLEEKISQFSKKSLSTISENENENA